MPKNIKNLSLNSRGLKYKLKISFYLMSVIPLLVCIYLVSSYISPQLGFRTDIAMAILISVLIAIIGFFLVKEVFDRVLSVTSEAKLIAAGDIYRKLVVDQTDEVADLGKALNQLTQRIRNNMDELKSYGEKTAEVNLEIQSRVIVLSSLLQISSLISQGAKLDDILRLIIEKSRLLANSDVSYLLFLQEEKENFRMRVADGVNSERLLKITIEPKGSLFREVVTKHEVLILDKQHLLDKDLTLNFREKFGFKNTLALPIFLRGKVIAILGIGNAGDLFSYGKEDLEMLDIFAKQISIALENDILIHRVEKLETKDSLTGLYNRSFIHNRLQEEIKRAIVYQRPCAFILLDIDNFKMFHKNFGSLEAEIVLKKIASLIRDSVTDVDRVARTGDGEFTILLPEKNKRKAQDTAEHIRRKIESIYSGEADANKKITVSGGVSENPLDGADSEAIIAKAKELLEYAKKQGKNRIVSVKEPTVCQ